MKNQEIKIFIKYLPTDETDEMKVDKSIKVYELTKKIENKLNISIGIERKLMLKKEKKKKSDCFI